MATALEPGPVMVAITPRPSTTTAGPLPVAITSRPIADNEFRVTKKIGKFSESLGCSCQADDDQPY
ncbi:hypothetical protein AB0H77_20135 [Streptomyces sp. NPDC050844]|uniref:hypothetical protein n=1 Tax=Streptomyces sp. NPDC050844 TaxID=3155790 RepID=UPI0033C86837